MNRRERESVSTPCFGIRFSAVLYITNAPSIQMIQQLQTVQRLMLSKGAKRTKFYHIAVILQYCWDKTIAWSGDMYRDDSCISSLII